MTIDVTDIGYDVEMITEDGTTYSLNNALTSLMWEEQENTLAQTATLTLAQFQIGNTWLHSLAKINCIIKVYGKWQASPVATGGRQLVFEGTIWEWQYTSSSTREITIKACDPLIRLQQSKDMKYFPAGLSTPAIIGEVCKDWGIPLDYKWAQTITHEKKVFSGNTISDIITELLREVTSRTGGKYVCYFRDGKMQIVGYGNNKDIYSFTKDNTTSTVYKLSINDLVTRVKIIGKADDAGRSAVEAVINGDLRYGVLQEIIRRDSDKDIAAAKAEAAATLRERGKPKENIIVTVPDLPFTRRGDVVNMAAGNLLGLFSILGASHNATQKQMTLTLEQFNPPPNSNTAPAEQKKDRKIGDIVNFLGGSHYYTSQDTTPRGGNRTAGTAKITNLAPKARHPIHLIGISSNVYGWVDESQIG